MENGPNMLVAIPEAPETPSANNVDDSSGSHHAAPPSALPRPSRLMRRNSPTTSPVAAGASSPPSQQIIGSPPSSSLQTALQAGSPSRVSGCFIIDRRMDVDWENLGTFQSMEINSSYSHLPKKDVSTTSPLNSPVMSRRTDLNNLTNTMHFDPMLHEQAFQQQIIQLKQQQQLQQQILLERYQAQRQQLDEHHEKEMQQRLQLFSSQAYWELKKQQEEERERLEKERLDAIKNKDKHEQSAVASSEVKQKLHGFLLHKIQREAAAAAAAAAANGGPAIRNWVHSRGADGKQSGGGPHSHASSSNVASSTHPYMHPMLGKYDDDFPLRKTASEPNLLKVRLKQRMIERRSSPMSRRRDRPGVFTKRKSQLAIDTASSTPDSGPNSPPNGAMIPVTHSSSGSTPLQQEGNSSPYGALHATAGQGSISDLTLYSSPSMPNISLGRPPVHSSSDGMKLPTVSEAAFSARLGLPLSGQVLPGSLPFYPSLPAVDPDYSSPTSPAYIHKQMQALEQSRPMHGIYPGGPITDAQVAQARLGKPGHRPLGRTQSAPLPLGHPILQGTSALSLTPQQYSEYVREKQLYEQQAQHNYLKQQIRQTVLHRAGSKNHVGNVDEEPESPVAKESRSIRPQQPQQQPEVIDLTDRKSEESEMVRQQREREQFLQQQRDLMMRHTLQISEGSAFTPRAPHVVRPLSRALSSPLVTLSPTTSPQDSSLHTAGNKLSYGTGIAFDSVMLKHQCSCGDNSHHPEHGGRLQSIWARLQEIGLVQRCERIRSRKATLEEIQLCHSEAHTLLFGTNPMNRQKLDMNKFAELPIKNFVRLPCGGIGVDSDTTWNELHTAPAARMAVGCVVELSVKVATGELKNGFAIVRPPGHHAEASQAMGFCFFNSVSIAAKVLQQRLKVERILIVDWDVHHGNGTQQMFYDSANVLYLSIHRHDDGNFFPGTGGSVECGNDDGLGFNVNVAWSGGLNPPMGDAEYLAVFRTIVMPIAKDFAPDVVLVSAGFDAAAGHPSPLGGYKVSSACFGYLTRQLMQLAGGKVILVLEGGYDLPAICDASQECMKALLGDELTPLKEEEIQRKPCQNAVEILQKTVAIQTPHWPCIKRYAHLVTCSAFEATQKEKESETISAMASLSMQHQTRSAATSLRSDCNTTPPEEPMDQDEGK